MSQFDDFFQALLTGAKGLAITSAEGFVQQARSAGTQFLQDSRADLERWTTARAAGQLTDAEFKVLVGTLAGLARLNALTQAGMAAARVQQLRDQLINLVINTAFKMIPIP